MRRILNYFFILCISITLLNGCNSGNRSKEYVDYVDPNSDEFGRE